MKILFVCLGNICRSPVAEAIFNHKIKELGLEKPFTAASCGTADYHIGDPPDPRAIANTLRNGVAMKHVCRQFTAEDFEEFDLILAMDKSNYTNILRLDENEVFAKKVLMMRDFDKIGKGEDVPDPWSGKEKEFQEVFEMLSRCMDGLIQYLNER